MVQCPDMTTRSPILAGGLSLLAPGLGQLYNGERAKGLAILCVTLGAWSGIWWSLARSTGFGAWLSAGMLAVAYLMTLGPAVVDAYRGANGTATPLLRGERAWYVVMMLLVVGPMALPLLWQSPRFSRGAKIAWSILVTGIALVVLIALAWIGPAVDRMITNSPNLHDRLR